MRNLPTLLFFCTFVAGQLHGQMLKSADFEFVDVAAYQTVIPAMPVEDAAGNKSTLREYIRKNQLHPGKPTVIVTWFTFCGGCKGHVDMMSQKEFGDKYNVVTLLLRLASRNQDTKVNLDSTISKGNKNRDWNKFLNLVSDDTLATRYLHNGVSTPLYLFADKNMNIHNSYVALSYDMVDVADKFLQSLENVSTNTKPGVRWYNAKDFPVPPHAPEAVKYTHTYVKGDLVYFTTMSTKDSSKVSGQYVKGDKLYLAHGRWETYDSKGKPDNPTVYHRGALAETKRLMHPNGKTASIIPVDGIAKSFDENGKLTMDGPMKNGLADGVFKLYKEGTLTFEISIRQGEYHGPYKVYEDGKVVSVTNYENGKEVR